MVDYARALKHLRARRGEDLETGKTVDDATLSKNMEWAERDRAENGAPLKHAGAADVSDLRARWAESGLPADKPARVRWADGRAYWNADSLADAEQWARKTDDVELIKIEPVKGAEALTAMGAPPRGDEVHIPLQRNPYSDPTQGIEYENGYSHAQAVGHAALNQTTEDDIARWAANAPPWRDGFAEATRRLGVGRVADTLSAAKTATSGNPMSMFAPYEDTKEAGALGYMLPSMLSGNIPGAVGTGLGVRGAGNAAIERHQDEIYDPAAIRSAPGIGTGLGSAVTGGVGIAGGTVAGALAGGAMGGLPGMLAGGAIGGLGGGMAGSYLGARGFGGMAAESEAQRQADLIAAVARQNPAAGKMAHADLLDEDSRLATEVVAMKRAALAAR